MQAHTIPVLAQRLRVELIAQVAQASGRINEIALGRGQATRKLSVLAVAVIMPLTARAADEASVQVAGGAPTLPAQSVSLTKAPAKAGQVEASPGTRKSEFGLPNDKNPNEKTTTGNLSSPPEPISNVPKGGRFPGFGEILLNEGIDLHGAAFDRFLANPSTGVITGRAENLLAIAPNLDIDLGKLVGIPGGTVHASALILALRADQPNYANYAGGNLVGEQATPGLPGKAVELSELTYEQRVLNGKFSIEAGQTSPYRYFFFPNSLDPLTHYSSVGTVDADYADLPFPVWGGRATYKLTSQWYLQTGAFEDNFRGATTYPGAFGDRYASGVQILGEIGYRTEFFDAAPRNFELGFEWNTRTGYSNVKGLPFTANAFDTAADYPGGGIIYAQGLQTLWHGAPRKGGSPPSINIYGSIDVAVDKPQPIDLDAMAGFNFTGFIPGRPFDATGIQVKYLRLSQIEANFETRNHDIFAGSGSSQPRDGFQFELIQNIQMTNSISIRPLAEYILTPDNTGNSTLGRRPSSGFQLGLFTVLELGPFLGTSNKPF